MLVQSAFPGKQAWLRVPARLECEISTNVPDETGLDEADGCSYITGVPWSQRCSRWTIGPSMSATSIPGHQPIVDRTSLRRVADISMSVAKGTFKRSWRFAAKPGALAEIKCPARRQVAGVSIFPGCHLQVGWDTLDGQSGPVSRLV